MAAGCGGQSTTPPVVPPIASPTEIATIATSSSVTGFALARAPIAATISQDHKLRILSFPDGAERHAIDIAGRAVDAFAIAPNGRFVAVGDHTGNVTVWSTETGQPAMQMKLARYPGLIVFSPDGATMATAAQGEAIQIVDVATGKTKFALGGPPGGTLALAFSPDGRHIATGDGDTVVRIYDAPTGRWLAENRDLLMVPLAVAFTADGGSVIASSGDKIVLFADVSSGKQTRKLDRTAQPVMYLDLSPDGKSLATAFMKAEDMTQPDHLVIREIAKGQPLTDWLPPQMPAGAGWTSDGRFIVALSSGDSLHLWRVR